MLDPQADVFIEKFGGDPNNIDVLTFWSVEPAYPSDVLRYHLGQLGTLRMMNELAAKGCVVQAFICDSESRTLVGGGATKPGRDISVTQRFIRALADSSIRTRLMSEAVEDLFRKDPDEFTRLTNSAVRGAQKFRECIQEYRPPSSVQNVLPQFRAFQESVCLDLDVQRFVDKLKLRCPTISSAELLSSLYASVRRPKWFDAFWMGDMAAWLSLYVEERQRDSPSRQVVLFEANRSAYSWMTHRCFLNIGLRTQQESGREVVWPEMCFAAPLLSTQGGSAMELSERSKAIFLTHKPEVIHKRLLAATNEALESYQRWLLPFENRRTTRAAQVMELSSRIIEYRKALEAEDITLLTRPAERRADLTGPQADVRIGLCLSGGGFRATFFHLGLIKLLRDAGLLSRVNAVYSVSGGSILAANLALNWDSYASGQDDEAFFEAASALFRLARTDVRGRIVRRFWLFLPFLGRWRTAYLERLFQADAVFGKAELGQLPELPFFNFLATSMKSGKLVTFTKKGFNDGTTLHDSSHLSVASAVSASSAFPPLFPPIALSAKDAMSGVESFPRTERLTDGGVFDNLGLTRMLAEAEALREEDWCNLALVSDASAPFEWSGPESFSSMVKRTVRTTDILMKRVAELEAERAARNISRQTQGNEPFVTVVKIEDTVQEMPTGTVGANGYCVQDIVIQKLTKGIRTDLDRFSMEEVCSLMRHGYEVGLRTLKDDSLLSADFVPKDPCGVPFPMCRDLASKSAKEHGSAGASLLTKSRAKATDHLRKHLMKSAKRRCRLWSIRDGASWTVTVVAAVLGGVLFLLY
ncbi:patatin-like phospholipase family protein [Bordetella genomosp. 5]|uniref:patatin-like phospholipase family protein n=1 Tax=Bordetella genomosp. 5 TaxID=1395608 RepID=UPI001595C65E|nr:patatin-like phospholipase family protein [Bordetella genomosp. 5]